MIAARPKRPAVLIVNPQAGRSSNAYRAEVVALLGRDLDLEVLTTSDRKEAIDLSRKAAGETDSLIIAFGGDGHVNEVVNGITGSDAVLGIIPGGTMNVFARSLGLPRDALDAAEHLTALDLRSARTVNLGMMDDMYFTFAAGCGFDAEAAALVESDLPGKRRFGEPFFYWSALRVLMGSHRHRRPWMTVSGPPGRERVAMAIACNTGPYAYLAGRPVRLLPEVPLDGGLSLFALRKMSVLSLPLYGWRAIGGGSLADHPNALIWADLDRFTISSEEPFPRHVDGETLDPATSAEFRLAPGSLKVLV